MSKTTIFVFLVVFWTLITIVTNLTDVTLSDSRISEFSVDPNENMLIEDSSVSSWIKGFFGNLEDVPFIKYFVPMFKIISFQYSDQIPVSLSIFLTMTTILSAFVVYGLVTGRT